MGRVKLEFRNARYADRDLRERISELVHYARYAGLNLDHFHKVISSAALVHGHGGFEMGYGGKLAAETDTRTLNLIRQIVEMYPVFATWDIKSSELKKKQLIKKKANKPKEKKMAVKKKKTAKKAAKKSAAKKSKKK